LKSSSWKTHLGDFVHEFGSRHDNRRIMLHYIKFNVDCARICVTFISLIVYLSQFFMI